MIQITCERTYPEFEVAINNLVGIAKAVTAGSPPIRVIQVDTDDDNGLVKALASDFEVEAAIEYYN